jgi:hypothetical protein
VRVSHASPSKLYWECNEKSVRALSHGPLRIYIQYSPRGFGASISAIWCVFRGLLAIRLGPCKVGQCRLRYLTDAFWTHPAVPGKRGLTRVFEAIMGSREFYKPSRINREFICSRSHSGDASIAVVGWRKFHAGWLSLSGGFHAGLTPPSSPNFDCAGRPDHGARDFAHCLPICMAASALIGERAVQVLQQRGDRIKRRACTGSSPRPPPPSKTPSVHHSLLVPASSSSSSSQPVESPTFIRFDGSLLPSSSELSCSS